MPLVSIMFAGQDKKWLNLPPFFDTRILEDDGSSPCKLLRFLYKHNVTTFEDIQMLSVDFLLQKRSECDLLQNRRFLIHLGAIAFFIELYEVIDLLEVQDEFGADSAEEIKARVHEHYHDEEFPESEITDSMLLSLPFFKADVWLHRIFEERHPIFLMNSAENRQNWLEKGALKIIERYPLLASQKYTIEADGENCPPSEWSPFFFVLYSGFGRDVALQVKAYDPGAAHDTDDGPFTGLDGILQKADAADIRVPLDVIKDVLSFFPNEATKRGIHERLLVECLLLYGYGPEYLDIAVSSFPLGHFDDLKIQWEPRLQSELDVSRARALEKIIVHNTRYLECGPAHWTREGFAHVLSLLSDNASTKVERLKLFPPLDLFGPEQELVAGSLQRLFTKKNQSLQEVAISCSQPHAEQEDFFAGYRGCLQSITQGLLSNGRDWTLQALTLDSFLFADKTTLETFLSRDAVGSLDIQVDGKRYECPWDENDKADESLQIQRVNLYHFHIPSECWTAMWKKISQLKRLERLMFAPGHLINNPTWILGALDAVSILSKLKIFCLGPHPEPSSIVNITGPLVALVEHGCLEFLQVEGSFEDFDEHHCLSYKIEVGRLCEALGANKSLQFLFLRGLSMEGTNISETFVDVFQRLNNTTIEFADICDDQHFYTVIPRHSWRRDPRHEFRYESFSAAYQIYHLTTFNRFGRSKVRDRSTTAEEFVKLLANMHAGIDLESREEKFYPEILAVADSSKYSDPTDYLTKLYNTLRRSPRSWYNAVKRDIESLGLKYALLRETPCLWCVAAASGRHHPRKRQRIEKR